MNETASYTVHSMKKNYIIIRMITLMHLQIESQNASSACGSGREHWEILMSVAFTTLPKLISRYTRNDVQW